MSTIVRLRRSSKLRLNAWQRHELLVGEVKPAPSYDGYTNGQGTDDLVDFISPEMKADWLNHRTELVAFWRSGQIVDHFLGQLAMAVDCAWQTRALLGRAAFG